MLKALAVSTGTLIIDNMISKNGNTMNLKSFLVNYNSYGESSIMKGIPITLLETVRSEYKKAGVTVKMRYRGPRRLAGRTDKHNAQSYCLKSHATTFAVYSI
jgi:hypothetical protein